MADAWAKFDREMSRLERSLEARERRGGDKPRNRGKQNAPNIEANWPGDEPNDNNVIPLGMYLEPPTAELTTRRIGEDASALNRAFGREPAADDLPEHWADWAEGDNARGDFQAQRRALIGSAGPLDPVAPRDPAHSLMIGEPIDELPTLEEARANTVRRRIGRLDEARFGLEPGTLGFVEPAVTGLREAVRDRDFGNALEGLGSAILADPSTGRRDPISRRNYDRVYGAPWGANLPGEDGLTDDQRASRRLADQMDPGFLGEDEITITASSRPERFGEAVGGLLAQDSWETPEARQRGLAEPFRDLGDLAVDLWTMPGRSQEEQAAREAGLLFDYSVSGSDMDLRAARQAAGEYGFNAASAGIELTPLGLAGDLASLGRVGARGVADALPARRLGETAPRAVDLPAPRDTSGTVDAEIAPPEPAPARRFEAALRDPETGEVYTGVDHTDAIESAPDGVRERLDAIYRAPSEDPNAVGFVVNGQFMSREDGLQALRASRRPVKVGEQVNRDGSVTERDPIDWDAPIAPERSALRDLGLGAAAGVGAGFGADAVFNQEANADNGEDGAGGEPLLPILGGVAGLALASRGGRNMRSQVNMFAGPNARTADRAALARAQEMAASGASRDDIWRDTGWFQGVDGKWRFEIDDSQSQMTLQPGSNYGRLNELIDHPELFEAYPQFDSIQASTHGAKRPSGAYTAARERPVGWGGSGGFVTDPPTLVANGSTPGSLRATTLHEGQHAIQTEEGFARGGSVRTVLTTEQLDEIDHLKHALRTQPRGETRSEMVARYNAIVQEGHDGYRRLAGEVESRNVEKRRNLTPTQRQRRPPWETQDVPDDQQIIRFDGGRAESRAQQRPWTDADIARAQEMRAEGATVRAIGEALGRSAGDVSRRLSAGLAPPKARGFDPRLSPDEGYAAQRRLAGLTPAQIADEMELPSGQVRVALHQARRKAPDLSIPSIAIGAGIGGAVAFGDEAFAQMAGEDGILEIGGLEIDTNGELPSMRDAVGAPVVSGDLYVQEFSDGSRHVFRMNRDGERPTPEYVGELVGTSFEVPRVGEGGATYDPGMPSPDWPPLPEGDGLDGELSDGVRIGGTLTAGLVARLMARRAGLGGVAGEIPGVVAAYGFNQVTGGDPVEGALLSGATPFAGRLAEYGAPRLGQAIDDTFYAPGQIARDNERLLSDPQFIMRRNQFAQTLPSAAPRARRLAVERDPLDGYASGRDPSGRMTDASEMLEQGYYADAAPQAMPPRVEFDTLSPAEQLAWMDRVGFAAPRAPAYPDRGNIGFVDGSSPEVEQMRRLGAPERADPFLQPSTGRSVFGEPRRQTVKPPPPPLAERAAERGSTGAMQGVKIAPMREIAEDLGIATEGVKAPELRRTLIRELARRFDSTAELVAFLRSYGVTAAALGIGIGGAQMVTEPEVTM